MEKTKNKASLIPVICILAFVGIVMGLVGFAQTDSVTATVTVSYYSVELDQSSFDYGTVSANAGTSTVPLWSGVGIEATNTGSLADFDIQGNNTTGGGTGWTLAANNTGNNYIHKFCNETDYDCSADPGGTNYTDLGINPSFAALDTGIAFGTAVYFQLYIKTPTAPTDVTQQSSIVTVQASAPD